MQVGDILSHNSNPRNFKIFLGSRRYSSISSISGIAAEALEGSWIVDDSGPPTKLAQSTKRLKIHCKLYTRSLTIVSRAVSEQKRKFWARDRNGTRKRIVWCNRHNFNQTNLLLNLSVKTYESFGCWPATPAWNLMWKTDGCFFSFVGV